MEKETKYCPHCGQKTEKEVKFCSQCGYNFETKDLISNDSNSNETDTTGKSVEFKKLTFKTSTVLVLVGLLAVIYFHFFYGRVAIAGEYENEDSIYDTYYFDTIAVSNKGKVTIKETDFEDSYSTTIGFNLIHDKGSNIYNVDSKKGIDMEFSFPTSYLFYEEVSSTEMNILVNAYGFKQSTNGEMTVISGKFTADQARTYGMDLSDLSIQQIGNNILLNEYELYLKK